MPYIPQSARGSVWPGAAEAISHVYSPGGLNFLITTLCLMYLSNWGENVGYSSYNEIIGVLECVKQEFYRRAVANYEDQKIKENGDVY